MTPEGRALVTVQDIGPQHFASRESLAIVQAAIAKAIRDAEHEAHNGKVIVS